jgi:beta-glucosidase
MARRILYALFATGAIDDPVKGDQSAQIDYAADAAITQADAEGGIVLLKNDGVLPLAKTAKKIVFIGAHSDVGVLSGGGSSQVYPHGGPQNGLILPNEGPAQFPGPMVWYPSSPMKGVQARSDAQLIYNDGRNAAKAAKLAADADVAVVFATQWSAEGMDQKDLSLPNHQDDLIAAVAKANPHTVVVLETGDPVTMPWLDQVGAVVEAWFPGTCGGEAIARVLTGEVNPSGHLPITFPASLDQLPRPVLPGQKGDPKTDGWYTADYDIEGAAVGYKWFDKKGYKPLFPFGYGLSYTTFAIDGLTSNGMTPQGLKLTLDMTNTGAVAGKGVAQIYVAGDGWEAPKRLGGFAKLDLAPGASQTTEITVDPRLLATYDPATKQWIIAAGIYHISAGQSSADIEQGVDIMLGKLTYDVNGHPISDN